MRVGQININGTKYPACLSTRVIMNIKEKTGKDFEAGINEILNAGNFEGLFWLMSQMLTAGARYNRLVGLEALEPPAEEDLLDLIGVDDYDKLTDTVLNAVVETSEPEVVLEDDGKNAKTTKPKA